MPYVSHSAGRVGETFIFPDGTERVLANLYLMQAKLMNSATLLKLYYSFCEVEVSGERLNMIFDDITTGRMGTVSRDDNDADTLITEPVITDIIYFDTSDADQNVLC